MEVMSLEDVYWVEDNAARTALGKDLPRWTQARQTLPTSKEDLETLKADLWSAVVKNSQHQDAWTWGTSSSITFCLFPRNKSTRTRIHFSGNRKIIISMLAICLKGFPERPKNLILHLEKEKNRTNTWKERFS